VFLSATIFIYLIFYSFLNQALGQPSPAQIQDAIVTAVECHRNTGEEFKAWSKEREEISLEIEQLTIRLKYLEHQADLYQAYEKQRIQEIALLEAQADKLGVMNLELIPYLAEITERLALFIQQDLDFLPEERTDRLKKVREDLTDYHLNQDEKLRRVLEALTVEAQYGYTNDTRLVEISVNGEERQLETLRLGRLAEYYRSADGGTLGWRNRRDREWLPLPSSEARVLNQAIEMADRHRVVELIQLPMVRPFK
jgi:hypothetical protein